MKRIVAGALLMVVAGGAFAQQTMYLKKDVLVCASESSYDRQISYLAQGVKKYADGCGATNKKYKVVPLDLNMMSPSKFEILELNQDVWVENKSITTNPD